MKKRLTQKNKIIFFILALFILYIAYGFYYGLQITEYTISNENIPTAFDGFKIVNISDLHCTYFGDKQEDLIEAIKACEPDIIALTGDIIDEKNIDYDCVKALLSGICNIAPIYYVSGNHELAHYDANIELNNLYQSYGVTVLDNQETYLEKDGQKLQLYGLSCVGSYFGMSLTDMINDTLPKTDSEHYSILLNHRSDIFDELSSYGYDLIISGHTHGGIIRLPFIGGLLSNDRTFFPKYDGGIFKENDSTMVSSRGLGESNSIPRFYNRRELVVITLKSK